ncbi:MAG: metal-dependent transcriptional regulator [Deinococcota bacterium]
MAKSTVPALSDAIGDYLKALWSLSQTRSLPVSTSVDLVAQDRVDSGDVLEDSTPVSTNDLATHLGVTAPSVTGMLNKLAKRGLVKYQRYYGATLTEAGRQEALRLIRRHRLIETFLSTYLDYSWDEVHEEAELMEHTMTERFTERLAAKLGHPTFDPHGDPIPAADGSLPSRPRQLLAELEVGDTLYVTRILSQDSHVLSYLQGTGIQPGTTLTVTGREPFGKLLHLDLKNAEVHTNPRTVAVSFELAQRIEGQRIEGRLEPPPT